VSEPGGRNPEVEGRIVVDPKETVRRGETRVLITNDDGVDAPGILYLADALATDFDVTIAAPSRDWSGAGTGIGHFDPRAGIPMRNVHRGDHRAYALDGPPGLAVMAAALGAFGPPFDMVVSGINAGINTGQSVIHSGTVGAALTARTFGSHGLAVSLEPSDPWNWDSAAAIALAVAKWITSETRQTTAINLNLPGVPIGEVRGLREAKLDRFGYFRVAVNNESGQKLEFEMSSHGDRAAEEGSDTWLLRNRYATVTSLGLIVGTGDVLPGDLSTIWSSEASITAITTPAVG
jgi:5'-nucleotidase